MSHPFPNQNAILAGSLEISFDIYRLPFSKLPSTNSETTTSAAFSQSKSAPPRFKPDRSIAEVISQAELTCGCNDSTCTNAPVLAKNHIFVETRVNQDPIFLQEEDLAATVLISPKEENKAKSKNQTSPKREDNQIEPDQISSIVLEVLKNDSLRDFDPFK